MSRQLTIFDVLHDTDRLSGTDSVHDAKTPKLQAIQRYLDRAEAEPVSHIETYSPGGRSTEYYRLVYRLGTKLKRIHIKGGNTSARLANYRADKLRAMIDRGAELAEVLEQLADFNGGTSHEN